MLTHSQSFAHSHIVACHLAGSWMLAWGFLRGCASGYEGCCQQRHLLKASSVIRTRCIYAPLMGELTSMLLAELRFPGAAIYGMARAIDHLYLENLTAGNQRELL
jgi:hypothetical protein